MEASLEWRSILGAFLQFVRELDVILCGSRFNWVGVYLDIVNFFV